MSEQVPGYEGTVGPGPSQYADPHVYARDVHSGAGNCVCGRHPGHQLHTEIAPGVPVPDWMRPAAPSGRAADTEGEASG